MSPLATLLFIAPARRDTIESTVALGVSRAVIVSSAPSAEDAAARRHDRDALARLEADRWLGHSSSIPHGLMVMQRHMCEAIARTPQVRTQMTASAALPQIRPTPLTLDGRLTLVVLETRGRLPSLTPQVRQDHSSMGVWT